MRRKEKTMKYALIIIAILAGWWAFVEPLLAPAFSAADIASLESSIKAEFQKRPGVTVLDVHLIRESERKLTGFVRIRIAGIEVAKPCTVTAGDDGGSSVWVCQ
jgi:hypothetical protein